MATPDKTLDAMVAASGTSYRSIEDALTAAEAAGVLERCRLENVSR